MNISLAQANHVIFTPRYCSKIPAVSILSVDAVINAILEDHKAKNTTSIKADAVALFASTFSTLQIPMTTGTNKATLAIIEGINGVKIVHVSTIPQTIPFKLPLVKSSDL